MSIRLAVALPVVEKIHLQNCMSCTKLIFNPTCEAAVKLKKRYFVIMIFMFHV